MKNVILRSLDFQNFASYVGKTHIDFQRCGLCLVRGVNHDTGGSSAAGKSNFLAALTYGLGYAPYPATALQSWLTEDVMDVAVGLELASGPATIHRGQRAKLVFGGKTTTSSVAVAKQLEDLTGLSPALMEALTFRAQGTRSTFLAMKDDELKSFLGSVLDLEKFEVAAEQSAMLAKERLCEVETLEAEIMRLEDQRESTEASMTSLVVVDVDETELRTALALLQTTEADLAVARSIQKALRDQITQTKIEAQAVFAETSAVLKAKLATIRAEALPSVDLTALEKAQAQELEIARRLRTLITKDEVTRRGTERAISIFDQKQRSYQDNARLAQQHQTRLEEYRKELAALEDSSCPTCLRHWTSADPHFADQTSQIQAKIATSEAIVEAHTALQRPSWYRPEAWAPSPLVDQFRAVQARARDSIENAKIAVAQREAALVAEKKSRIEAVQTEIAAERSRCLALSLSPATDAAFAESFRAVEALEKLRERQAAHAASQQTLVSRAQVQRAGAEALRQAAQARLSQIRQTQDVASIRLREAKAALAAELDFGRLVGREGFLGAIFDEVLEEIAAETNSILAAVPNVQTVSMRFRSESSTAKGITKRNIRPVVSISGREIGLPSGLSGGQTTSFGLAVDLGVGAVISRRTGATPGWLILDEPFTGLGLLEKEAFLGVLQRHAQTRAVFVVDHENAFAEFFSSTIEIHRKDGRSYIIAP